MFLLEMALFIAGVIAGFVMLRLIDRSVFAKYQHRFLKLLGLSIAGSGVWAMVGGYALGGLTGAVLIAAGAASCLALTVFNIRKTSLAFGLAGSAVQLVAGSVIGVFGLAIALPAAMVAAGSLIGHDDPALRRAYGDPNPHP